MIEFCPNWTIKLQFFEKMPPLPGPPFKIRPRTHPLIDRLTINRSDELIETLTSSVSYKMTEQYKGWWSSCLDVCDHLSPRHHPDVFQAEKKGGKKKKKKRKKKKINNWTHDATGSDLIGYMLRWFVKWSYKQLRGGGIGTTYQLMTDWDFDIKCQL